VISTHGSPEKLLIANNLSDNVILIDSKSGRGLEQFGRQYARNDSVFISFQRGCIARWPPRLVQSVECFPGSRTQFGEWNCHPLDSPK